MSFPTNEPPYQPDQIEMRVAMFYDQIRQRAIQEDRRQVLKCLPIPHKQDYDIDHQGNLMYIGDYKRPMHEKYDWHNPIMNKPIVNISQPIYYGDLINNDGYRYANVRIEYDQDNQALANQW